MKTIELFEKAKGTPPDWAAKEQAEFRTLVSQFGFQLTTIKPAKGNIDNDQNIGGTVKDKGVDELMSVELRFEALKKGVAKHLLQKAQSGRTVKIFHETWYRHTPRYIHPEDTLRAAEAAVDNTVYFARRNRNRPYDLDNPVEFNLCWALSEPK